MEIGKAYTRELIKWWYGQSEFIINIASARKWDKDGIIKNFCWQIPIFLDFVFS